MEDLDRGKNIFKFEWKKIGFGTKGRFGLKQEYIRVWMTENVIWG